MTAAAPRGRGAAGGTGRNRYLAAIHAGAKALGWDEDHRRDVMAARYNGKRSARELTDAELQDFARFIGDQGGNPKKRPGSRTGAGRQPARAGRRPLAPGAEASKVRALWLSLYHLGELSDPSEAALDAWVQRQTAGAKQSLRFCERDEVDRLIRGLRAWCERVGFELPDAGVVNLINEIRFARGLTDGGYGIASKVELVQTQRRRLGVPNDPMEIVALSREELDALIEELGRRVRARVQR